MIVPEYDIAVRVQHGVFLAGKVMVEKQRPFDLRQGGKDARARNGAPFFRPRLKFFEAQTICPIAFGDQRPSPTLEIKPHAGVFPGLYAREAKLLLVLRILRGIAAKELSRPSREKERQKKEGRFGKQERPGAKPARAFVCPKLPRPRPVVEDKYIDKQ